MKSALLLAFLSLLAVALLRHEPSPSEFEQGLAFYYSGHYYEARQHLSTAVKDDPTFATAQLYLGRIEMSDWGAEDLGVGPRAVKAFTAVLNVEPNNLEAIRSLASTYFSMARPSEARLFCWRAIQLAPRDADMFYLLGVIDWAEAYQPRMKYRYEHNIPLKDSLFDKPGCAGMREKNLATVDEGMDMLRRALATRADFRDAMAYLNLLYRERADIQCGNPVAHSVDMKAAEDWLARWSATKDSSAWPDYRSGYYLPLPPPPPPPPSNSPSR